MTSDDANHVSIEKSFRIKQDDRFFSKVIAKEETSGANTSSRVFYYGETSVTVPFVWEAQPGIPKHPLSETFLPPLTPPPSYYSKFSNSNTNKRRKSSKANIFSCILPRFVACSRRKTHVSSSPSSSPSSSSSSWSLVYPLYSYSMRDKNQGSFSFSRSTTIVRSFLKHKSFKWS